MSSFNDFNLSEEMVAALAEKGFTSPSPIQALVIPEFLREKANIIGQAQTGTGKTAAFSIPIIESITKDGSIKAVVLTPTRELAIQVCEEMYSLIGKRDLRVSAVYGGASIEQQVRNVRKGSDIIVGTPGRIMDLMERKVLNFNNLEFFVLDEADEMLNMGFVEDIEHILQTTNQEKNMLFFSATMPSSILQIAKKYMGKFKTLKVENKELTTKLTEQIYFEVREGDKFEALCRVLDFEQDFYGIIFCRTKLEVDEVTKHLKSRSYAADCLHGDITQSQRTKTLAEFKDKLVNILVATDVAARGIDVNNLTHVINYSMPQEAESYVHRIGRTGRAGQKGIAITFVTPREMSRLGMIKKVAKADIKKQEVPQIKDIIKAKEEYLQACLGEIIAESDFKSYNALASRILGDNDPQAVIAALLRHQYQDEFLEESYAKIEQSRSAVSGDNVKLFVALGKIDGMNPRALLDVLHQSCKTPGRKVRDIRILEKFSFITVPLDEAEIIMRKLNQKNKKMVEVAKS
ncbi:MAG TPA: DEAD/DEAH box helicase [Burkholderiales bacterium]|nr:DEAD/DEAH box helicase [Burkholderiales bacterium]